MSVTSVPLHLLDRLSIRVFLDTSASTEAAWHVHTIDRDCNNSPESTDSRPHITLDLVKTGGVDNIRIRSFVPQVGSPTRPSHITNGRCYLHCRNAHDHN